MEKSAREGSLGSLAEGAYQMAPSSSSLVGGSLSAYSAYFMLLRAAIDGDLRLLKEMVVCLDKGQGEAATVEAVSYKGIGVMHIAAHMGRKPVLDYLELELGMDSTLINDVAGETTGQLSKGAYIDGIICEVTSKFPQAQGSSVGIQMQEHNSGPSWEDLPSDLVFQIACTFCSAEIYCKVRSVCQKWAHAMANSSPPLAMNSIHIPFLLLPPLEPSNIYSIWKLRNRNNPSVDVLGLPYLSCTAHNVVVGSSFGWIIMFDPCLFSLVILNPITGERITLPSIGNLHWESTDPTTMIQHAVLSANPSSTKCWTVLLFLTSDNSSCFSYRFGNMWIQHIFKEEHVIMDVLYFVDRFVALTEDGCMGIFDVDTSDPQIDFVCFTENLLEGSHYLVLGSEHELLLVTCFDFHEHQVIPSHIPLIEKLFILSRFVKREICVIPRVIFLGYSNSIAMDLDRLPPSVEGGVFRTQTYSRLMGSKGCLRCGGVIRAVPNTSTIHDILHAQVFTDDDVWLTRRPWWVTPNIFRRSPTAPKSATA